MLFHVHARDPLAARLTKDVNLAVDREDLVRIAGVVHAVGLEHRHVAGVDMLVDAAAPSARSAVHLVLIREKVRPQYPAAVPDFSEPPNRRAFKGIVRLREFVVPEIPTIRLLQSGRGIRWLDLSARCALLTTIVIAALTRFPAGQRTKVGFPSIAFM